MTSIPKVLSIAGSDPSGGAGIQADMKSMSALRTYAMSIPTALTAQSTRGVDSVYPVPVDVIQRQIDVLLADITPDATKIGMLGSGQVIRLIGGYLADLHNVVVDPVMVSTSGKSLLDDDGIASMRELRSSVDLITPNLPEASVLLGCPIAVNLDESTEQAQALYQAGWERVLLKGGHLDGHPVDVYIDADGVRILSGARIDTRNTHGTGCTLSSAIVALRAHGHSWYTSVAMAKAYMGGALSNADQLDVGSGCGPLHHFYSMWENPAL